MSEILIKLTPLEPYFFGGENIFEIGDGNKHYFIRSLDTPSQTMLFGILRYLAIAPENLISKSDYQTRYNTYKKNSEFKHDYQGYALNRPDISFGNIKKISPLYIIDNMNGVYYIPVPLDHQADKNVYTPFKDFHEVQTNNGLRRLPKDFNVKNGIAYGWMEVSKEKNIYRNLFNSKPQIGIDTKNKSQSFYKKEYKVLKDGFSFAFFADINMPLYNRTVYMGQGKSSFKAEWVESKEPEFPSELFNSGIAYAQSDIYIHKGNESADLKTIYENSYFSAVQTRDYRIFTENNLYRKASKNIKLIKSGSVFYPKDMNKFLEAIHNDHASIAGFNKIIIGGNKH